MNLQDKSALRKHSDSMLRTAIHSQRTQKGKQDKGAGGSSKKRLRLCKRSQGEGLGSTLSVGSLMRSNFREWGGKLDKSVLYHTNLSLGAGIMLSDFFVLSQVLVL